MSYKQEKVESITVRITYDQRKMLAEMVVEQRESLSGVVRDILERERKRRKRGELVVAGVVVTETELLVPPRRR